MPRFLRTFPVLVALAFAAIALMTVLLPSTTTTPSQDPSQQVTIKQALDLDAAVERVAPEPRGRTVVVAAPSPGPEALPEPEALTPGPAAAAAPLVAVARPVPTAAPPAPAVTAPPPACPAALFCYPRLGISGAVVPYSDCSGATDVGAAIRRLTCVRSAIWLAGHAYTPFGGITGYRVGDVVLVLGQRFEITGATVQRSCAPVGAIAPLSLQTSLETATCGRVLVVQGR